MRALPAIACLPLLALATPARAQLSNASIGLEAGVSAPRATSDAARARLALTAGRWLDGDVEAIARIAWASAPETPGRGTAALAGTVGLRWSLLPDPLRPQLELELGWARRLGADPADGVALGVSIGAEWFLARDLSIALRAALRRGPGAEVRGEGTLGAAAYF
jgi:hypothetical protein